MIGRLPTPDEARAFLADTAPDKRAQAGRSRCWSGRSTPTTGRTSGPTCCGRIRTASASRRSTTSTPGCATPSASNMPYDQFVREIVTAQGSTFRNGAAVVFRDRREPDEITTMVSQLFLGIRLDCAKCHHHPFEVWSQDDFYSFAAYFARIGRKGAGLSPPISGGEEVDLRRGTAARSSIRSRARCCRRGRCSARRRPIDAEARPARGAGRLDRLRRTTRISPR